MTPIDSSLQTAAQTLIQQLLGQVSGLRAVVVSTEDGFEVAAHTDEVAQVARLSAMASSLAALSAVAGEESKLGACDHVLIGAANGHILMMQCKRGEVGLIVSLITSKEVILGQALYALRHAVKELQKS